MGGYTVGELERDTGFSRRTIAYYIQLGLLPRVGRLGPKTRYPALVRDRLRFIRRVREAQEAGEVPPVSLEDIGDVFERAPPDVVASVADGREPVTGAIFSPPRPMYAPPSRRRAALEPRSPPSGRGASDAYDTDSPWFFSPGASVVRERSASTGDWTPRPARADDAELAGLLAMLDEAAGAGREGRGSSVETWSRVEVTPSLALSVRGLADEDAALLERVGSRLRQLMRDDPRSSEVSGDSGESGEFGD